METIKPLKYSELIRDDLIPECTANDIFEHVMEAKKFAIRENIEANAIIINKNMVKVPEIFGNNPAMICGLNAYWTKGELPDGYSFGVFHNPNLNADRLAKFESIGMEPEELRKAAELYRYMKENM